jgi:hypothetical protein
MKTVRALTKGGRTYEIVPSTFYLVDRRISGTHFVELFRSSEDTSDGVDSESE